MNDYLIELGSEYLTHYGVKGMKWKKKKGNENRPKTKVDANKTVNNSIDYNRKKLETRKHLNTFFNTVKKIAKNKEIKII